MADMVRGGTSSLRARAEAAGLDLDAKLSPHALAVVLELPSEPALREAIHAERVRSHPAGGGGRRGVRVREFLEDTDELDPCPCGLPGLSGAGGCGIAGHVRAGRPKSEKTRAKQSESRAALREGGRPIAQVAAEFKCAPANLERVAQWRRGPAGEKLIDDAEVERIKREHVCRNCGALAVGPSGHCRTCAAPAVLTGLERTREWRRAISEGKRGKKAPNVGTALRRRAETDPEFRARLAQQLDKARSTEQKNIAAQLRSAGKVATATAAELLVFSRHSIWSAGARERQGAPVRQGLRRLTKIEYVEVMTTKGKVLRRLGFDPKEVADSYYQRTGSKAAYGWLNTERAAAKGTIMGPGRVLEDGDTRAMRVLELRADGRSMAKIAAEVGVSPATVCRFLMNVSQP